LKTKELIGKEIIEIRSKISTVESEGSIPLETIDVEMKLSTGEIVTFPHHPDANKIDCQNFDPKLNVVFPKNGIIQALKKPNLFDNLKHKVIVGIWLIVDDFGEEICAIEFQNEWFLVKGPMSPKGTGNADLIIYNSLENLKTNYESDVYKVH